MRSRTSCTTIGSGLVVALGSCTVPSLDLSGRPCPCLDDWVCNPDTRTCEPAAAGSTGGGDTSDASSDPTAASGDGSTSPGFHIVDFAGDWSTPTTIHWAWTVEGEEASFHAYEVWVATSEAALSSDADAVVFDATVNPELSRWILDNTNDPEPVAGTITDGLEPGTEYFARLFVLDTAGGRTASPNVAVRSTAALPVDEHVIYADDPPAGGLALPLCMTRTDAAPAAGSTHHYAHVMKCSPTLGSQCEEGGAAECWENLRLQNLPLSPLVLGDGEFAGAFLEAYVAIDGASAGAHGWWSEFGLQDATQQWHAYKGLTLRADGSYRRYEIPLSRLGLTADTFDGTAVGFRVGSTFPDGTTVRFDEVRVRW